MRTLFILWLTLLTARSATYTASSVSHADVATAMASASAGDSVSIPAGSATWSTHVAVKAGVTVYGAGTNATFITRDTTAGTAFILSNAVNFSSISITQASSSPTSQSVITVPPNTTNVVIHDVGIWNVNRIGLLIDGSASGFAAKGVIYNSTIASERFPGNPGGGVFQLIRVWGTDTGTPPSSFNTDTNSMYGDPVPGTGNFWYVENCFLDSDAQGDASIEIYNGGRICVRFCQLRNFTLGYHGHDSSTRSGHWSETYGNTNYVDIGSSSYQGWSVLRGGSILACSNITTTSAATGYGNTISLLLYPAAGLAGAPLNGTGNEDGNTPYDPVLGVGTHTGGNNATTLTDGTKSWGTDAFLGFGTYATNDTLYAMTVWNRTDGSWGTVTANSGTTVTTIVPGDTVTLTGGTDNDWDTGDEYVITYGYPGLDQPGWTGPTRFLKDIGTDTIYTYSTQQLNPCYSWANTWDGAGSAMTFGLPFNVGTYTNAVQPDNRHFIQENREYYNNTTRPGWTPYTYPHPLSLATDSGESSPAVSSRINSGVSTGGKAFRTR